MHTYNLLKYPPYFSIWKEFNLFPFDTFSTTENAPVHFEGPITALLSGIAGWQPFWVVLDSSTSQRNPFGSNISVMSFYNDRLDARRNDVAPLLQIIDISSAHASWAGDLTDGAGAGEKDVWGCNFSVFGGVAYDAKPPALLSRNSQRINNSQDNITSSDDESNSDRRGREHAKRQAKARSLSRGRPALTPSSVKDATQEPNGSSASEEDEVIPQHIQLKVETKIEMLRWVVAIHGAFSLDSNINGREMELKSDGILPGNVTLDRMVGRGQRWVLDTLSSNSSNQAPLTPPASPPHDSANGYNSSQPWGLLYLTVSEVAGIDMVPVGLAASRTVFTKVLTDKTLARMDQQLEQWMDVIKLEESVRRGYEVWEVESKLKKSAEDNIINEGRSKKFNNQAAANINKIKTATKQARSSLMIRLNTDFEDIGLGTNGRNNLISRNGRDEGISNGTNNDQVFPPVRSSSKGLPESSSLNRPRYADWESAVTSSQGWIPSNISKSTTMKRPKVWTPPANFPRVPAAHENQRINQQQYNSATWKPRDLRNPSPTGIGTRAAPVPAWLAEKLAEKDGGLDTFGLGGPSTQHKSLPRKAKSRSPPRKNTYPSYGNSNSNFGSQPSTENATATLQRLREKGVHLIPVPLSGKLVVDERGKAKLIPGPSSGKREKVNGPIREISAPLRF